MMSAGPWKPIRLETYYSRIEELHFPVTLSEDLSSATVNYSVTLDSPPSNGTLKIALHPPNQDPSNTTTPIIHIESPVSTSTTVSGTFTVKQPQLWYPINY